MDQVKFVEDSLKKVEVIWSAKVDHITSNFLKVVFHECYLVHSEILCPNCSCYFLLAFSHEHLFKEEIFIRNIVKVSYKKNPQQSQFLYKVSKLTF